MNLKQPCPLRRATEDDAERIARLWLQMMGHHAQRDERFAVAPDSESQYIYYLKEIMHGIDNRVLVAEIDDRVVGYVIGMIMSNPPIFALPRYGFIAEMAVEEEYRHLGIGKRLWKAIIEWCKTRSINVVQLNVSTVNELGQQFWRGRGCRDFLHILWYDIPQED